MWHPAPVLSDDNPLINYDSVKIPYGIDEDGHVMYWRPAVDPHMMLVGSSGTGKTVTAHTVLTEVTANGWIVWVVDGKGVEFLGFQDWPNVQIVAAQIAHQVAVIHRAWQVMEERYAAIIAGEAQETDFEPLVLFIDEFADFRGNLLNWYSMIKGKEIPPSLVHCRKSDRSPVKVEHPGCIWFSAPSARTPNISVAICATTSGCASPWAGSHHKVRR